MSVVTENGTWTIFVQWEWRERSSHLIFSRRMIITGQDDFKRLRHLSVHLYIRTSILQGRRNTLFYWWTIHDSGLREVNLILHLFLSLPLSPTLFIPLYSSLSPSPRLLSLPLFLPPIFLSLSSSDSYVRCPYRPKTTCRIHAVHFKYMAIDSFYC